MLFRRTKKSLPQCYHATHPNGWERGWGRWDGVVGQHPTFREHMTVCIATQVLWMITYCSPFSPTLAYVPLPRTKMLTCINTI